MFPFQMLFHACCAFALCYFTSPCFTMHITSPTCVKIPGFRLFPFDFPAYLQPFSPLSVTRCRHFHSASRTDWKFPHCPSVIAVYYSNANLYWEQFHFRLCGDYRTLNAGLLPSTYVKIERVHLPACLVGPLSGQQYSSHTRIISRSSLRSAS